MYKYLPFAVLSLAVLLLTDLNSEEQKPAQAEGREELKGKVVPTAEDSIIPRWEKGDWWKVKFFKRYDQVKQYGDAERNERMRKRGFVGGNVVKFTVTDVSDEDGSATVEFIIGYSMGGQLIRGYMFTVSRTGVLKEAVKIEIDKRTNERKVTKISDIYRDIDPRVIYPGRVTYPDVQGIRQLEKDAAEIGVKLLSIEIEDDGVQLWEQGLPWWKQKVTFDSKGKPKFKAYLVQCHYKGQDISFKVPSDVGKIDEGSNKKPVEGTRTEEEDKTEPDILLTDKQEKMLLGNGFELHLPKNKAMEELLRQSEARLHKTVSEKWLPVGGHLSLLPVRGDDKTPDVIAGRWKVEGGVLCVVMRSLSTTITFIPSTTGEIKDAKGAEDVFRKRIAEILMVGKELPAEKLSIKTESDVWLIKQNIVHKLNGSEPWTQLESVKGALLSNGMALFLKITDTIPYPSKFPERGGPPAGGMGEARKTGWFDGFEKEYAFREKGNKPVTDTPSEPEEKPEE